MELTKNLLLHWWHYLGTKGNATVEETQRFEKLIDAYGTEKVFRAIVYNHSEAVSGLFAAVRFQNENEFLEEADCFKIETREEEVLQKKIFWTLNHSYETRTYKDGGYTIVAFPAYAFELVETRTEIKRNYTYEIRPHTFPGVSFAFPIRERAIDFAFCRNPNEMVYAVLYGKYAKEVPMMCLFFLKFTPENRKIPMICRCIGKKEVRYHWLPVRKYVEEHGEEIVTCEKTTFSVDW